MRRHRTDTPPESCSISKPAAESLDAQRAIGSRAPLSAIAPPIALVVLCLASVPVYYFNHRIFIVLNGSHSPYSDWLWLGLTTLGDGLCLTIVIGAFLIVNPRITVLGIILLLLSSIAVNTIKALYPTLRPAGLLESVHVIGPLLRSGAFPSGHTASSLVAALSIAYFLPSRALGVAIVAVGALIGISRIFVGAHFPIDVLGGWICAIALFWLFTSTLWPRWEPAIPSRAAYASTVFRLAVGTEFLLALFSLVVYSSFFAESAIAGAAISFMVIVIVGRFFFRNSRELLASNNHSGEGDR